MENSGEKVSKEEVIAKLKDDGDFDRLRLKIIRKLKDKVCMVNSTEQGKLCQEELREQIASVVKQSAALHREGAENMKPRQLSDAIYAEVGDKVMSQISDSLWQIIRSNDGMKSEIEETVQSVYNKLVNPKGKDGVVSSLDDVKPNQRQGEMASAANIDDTLCDNEPTAPPGFTLLHNRLINNDGSQFKGNAQIHTIHGEGSAAEHREEPHPSRDTIDAVDVGDKVPTGFPAVVEPNPPPDCSDEDPDVPPGFG